MQKASMGARFGAAIIDGILINILAGTSIFLSFHIYVIIYIFSFFMYYGLCEGSYMSATFGKKICGIVVVDPNGNKLSFGQGFLRSLCRYVSGIFFGIGFIMAVFDDDYKATHDKMAKTFVVSRNSMRLLNGNQQQNELQITMPQIIGITGYFANKVFSVQSDGIVLGRDYNLCGLAFPENTKGISRKHCKIIYNQQTQMFILYDLGSTNGTFTGDDIKVIQGQPKALRSGEDFYLANRNSLFRVKS